MIELICNYKIMAFRLCLHVNCIFWVDVHLIRLSTKSTKSYETIFTILAS